MQINHEVVRLSNLAFLGKESSKVYMTFVCLHSYALSMYHTCVNGYIVARAVNAHGN